MKSWRCNLFCFGIVATAFGACDFVPRATPVPTAQPAPIESSTGGPEPATASPPPTEKPSASTSTPHALSSRPYLAYDKIVNGRTYVTLVDQDGLGNTSAPLPESGFIESFEDQLSPNGEWLAFHEGSGSDQTVLNGPNFDLALYLMHLPDGRISKVTGLLSQDFPANLDAMVQSAHADRDIGSMPDADIKSMIREGLNYSLFNLSWSPNGRYLAFSGEMDGPSSDLYVYEVATKQITRLSSGPQLIDFIIWFPDQYRILYSSSYGPCEGDCSTYHIASRDGKISKTFTNFDTYGGATRIVGWADSSTLTVFTTANVSGTCCLRNFNFDTGRSSGLYSGSFDSVAVDPLDDLLALSLNTEYGGSRSGIYVFDGKGETRISGRGEVNYIGWPHFQFVVRAQDTELLARDGTSKVISDRALRTSLSPNREYLALYDGPWSQKTSGLRIVGQGGETILDVDAFQARSVIWRPDSAGLFFVADDQLFYLDLKEAARQLIDPQIVADPIGIYSVGFGWIR
jgi:hypothetical protein